MEMRQAVLSIQGRPETLLPVKVDSRHSDTTFVVLELPAKAGWLSIGYRPDEDRADWAATWAFLGRTLDHARGTLFERTEQRIDAPVVLERVDETYPFGDPIFELPDGAGLVYCPGAGSPGWI